MQKVTCAEHVSLAREIASAATVLLKNEASLLPLNPQGLRVVVVGSAAQDEPIVSGGYFTPP